MVVESSVTGRRRVIMVPCGKCVECLKARQNSWKLRICEESKNWKHFYFFTLTYNDENLPMNIDYETGEYWSTNRKSDVQNWIKRLRESVSRNLGERMGLKYFVCSEYGPRGTRRPHYHGIFMTDVSYNELASQVNSWASLGYYEFKEIMPYDGPGDTMREQTSKVANYISKYCSKFGKCSRQEDIDAGHCSPEWSVMSKGIGDSYVFRMKHWHLCDIDWESEEFPLDGQMYYLCRSGYNSEFWKKVQLMIERSRVSDGDFTYNMPRYYKDRIYGKVIRTDRAASTGECSLKIAVGTEFQTESVPLVYRPVSSPVTYKVRTNKIVRYNHENLLSVALNACLHWQHDARYNRDFIGWKESHPDVPDVTYHLWRQHCEEVGREARRIRSEAALSRFYTTNMFKNRKLNFA